MKSLREVTLPEFRAAFTPVALRKLQIVQLALGFGTLNFAVIVVVLTMSKTLVPMRVNTPGLADGLSLANGAFFILSFAISAVAVNAMFSRSAINRQCNGAPEQCVNLLRKATIVRLAIHEISAFFGLVVCLLIFQNKAQPIYWLNALAALVELLIVAITFPTQQRIEDVFREKIQSALP